MKLQLLSTALLIFASTNVFAQGQSRTKALDDGYSAKGVRVSFLKPDLELKVKATYEESSFSGSNKLEDTLGVGVGYAFLPVQNLGWTTNFSYIQFKDSRDTAHFLRLDGNLAYTFTDVLNLKGGVNVSKIGGAGDADKITPGIGFQASLGVQATRNFGIDFGYTQMKQAGSDDGIKWTLEEAGFELGLNGTF